MKTKIVTHDQWLQAKSRKLDTQAYCSVVIFFMLVIIFTLIQGVKL